MPPSGAYPRVKEVALRSSDFAAFVKMMQALLEVWKWERPGSPTNPAL